MRTELRVLLIRDPPTTHGANWMTRCYQATKKIRIGFFWNRTAFFVGLLLQKSFIECTKVCAVSVLGHSTHKMDQDEFYHNPGAFASKTSSCLQTWQPILQLFDYFSSSATTPKKQIHCHLLYFGCYQPAKKKLDGVVALEFLDNRTELLVVGWCSSRTQTLLICLSLELTPCWANYPKLFGQTICQMSRALLAHKEEKLRGKTKPAVLSCIPKNTLSIFSFFNCVLTSSDMLMISCIPAKGKLWISAKNSTHPSPIILDFW